MTASHIQGIFQSSAVDIIARIAIAGSRIVPMVTAMAGHHARVGPTNPTDTACDGTSVQCVTAYTGLSTPITALVYNVSQPTPA